MATFAEEFPQCEHDNSLTYLGRKGRKVEEEGEIMFEKRPKTTLKNDRQVLRSIVHLYYMKRRGSSLFKTCSQNTSFYSKKINLLSKDCFIKSGIFLKLELFHPKNQFSKQELVQQNETCLKIKNF